MIQGGKKGQSADDFNPYVDRRQQPAEAPRRQVTLAQIAPRLGQMMHRVENAEIAKPQAIGPA